MDITDLLAQVPLDQFASTLGVGSPQAEDVARQAITALVGGMGANAQDPAGATSLASALGEHAGGTFPGGTDLAKVDTADGNAIVANIFGANQGDVTGQLGAQLGGDGSSLLARALPLLAPLVLRWVGGAVLGNESGGAVTGASRIAGVIPGNQDDGGGIEGILGGLLGGAGGSGSGGDALGGLLGSGGAGALGGLLAGDGGGADLGGLLDGLLGDGKRA